MTLLTPDKKQTSRVLRNSAGFHDYLSDFNKGSNKQPKMRDSKKHMYHLMTTISPHSGPISNSMSNQIEPDIRSSRMGSRVNDFKVNSSLPLNAKGTGPSQGMTSGQKSRAQVRRHNNTDLMHLPREPGYAIDTCGTTDLSARRHLAIRNTDRFSSAKGSHRDKDLSHSQMLVKEVHNRKRRN